MVDTIRTLSALQTLLADNATGEISEQDLRDMLVSTYLSGTAGYVEPPTASWSWVNQGSATETVQSDGSITMFAPSTGANNFAIRVRSYTAPETVTIRISPGPTGATNGGPGLLVREAATGELRVMYAKPGGAVVVEEWFSPTSFSTGLANISIPEGHDYWMQIEDNNTNLIYRMSTTGAPGSFRDWLTVSRTSFLTPDQWGWAVRDNSADHFATLLSWGVA